MKSTRPLQGLLILWALWEVVNASLSTFASSLGASFVGWVPKNGWTGDLYSMSQQYGMVLFILAAVYVLIATDPLRYRAFVWIPIGEQAIGIAYALYGLLGGHTMTGSQFVTQAIVNVVVAALFYLLRPSVSETSKSIRAANSGLA
ncbi:MAG: hypothetical protein IAI49_02440 [Candidatus Eremiobacteraeota bacterium]|nr:hypothetical protein [Candidatus Eremiobacteraeota bacterium]